MTPAELDSSALKSSVAFTGRLACMTRAEAFEVVRQHGGTPSKAVTKRTKLLIVGELGWPLLDDGRPSNKLTLVRSYSVPVVSERRFLEWIGKFIPDNANKTYSVDQLASLSGLSGEKIQELAQLSLLDELLADGVRLSEIIRSVNEIRKWLPDIGLASVRLHPGPCDSLEVEQAGGRTDKHGQFVLAVDDCRHNPDDLFASAQVAEEIGDIAEAERFYRVLMKSDPTDPTAAFNLGNMLRAHGRNVEAEAVLRAATRIDPAFAEAWYNLGDLLDEQGRCEVAIECLRKTLQVAPDYADAMFNLALLLQRRNECAEAAIYWRRYLAFDGQSEWATRARRSLKFCEMQQHLIA
jgi:tetratricopeptide (TPR) repeat protein